MRRLLGAVCLSAFVSFVVPSWAADGPCVSGLKPGQRPGPYSFLVATGPQRGQPTCYVCETGDKPAVVIFARTLGDPLGKLVQKLDRAVADHKADELRAWVTFLSDDQAALDPKVVRWGKEHAVRNVPLGVFEDVAGPPSYRLARDADVTVLLFVKQKVVANFAFRAGELTDDRAAAALEALPRILGK
jgi:hypothetical protein